jgi:hypothetical protein
MYVLKEKIKIIVNYCYDLSLGSWHGKGIMTREVGQESVPWFKHIHASLRVQESESQHSQVVWKSKELEKQELYDQRNGQKSNW